MGDNISIHPPSGPIVYKIEEQFNSRIWDRTSEGSTLELVFKCYHCDPIRVTADVPPHGSPLTWLLESETGNSLAPFIYDPVGWPIYFLNHASVAPIDGENACKATLNYKEHWHPGMNAWHEIWDFDFMSHTEQATTVRDASYRENFPATADPGLVINYNEDRVEGTPKQVKTCVMHCRKLASFCTPEYLITLSQLQACLNQGPFAGFKPRQVLFMGATASTGEFGEIILNYTFAMGPLEPKWADLDLGEVDGNGNVTTTRVYIGWNKGQGGLTCPSPFDFVWYRYRQKASVGMPVKGIVSSAHLDQIYEDADFDLLQLAGPMASRLPSMNNRQLGSSGAFNQWMQEDPTRAPFVQIPMVSVPQVGSAQFPWQ
jgi:hypothetical protein